MTGTKTLLIGAPGTGKTTSLLSLVEAGLELRVLALESNYDMLLGNSKVKIHYIPPVRPSWDSLINSAKMLNTYSNEALQKLARMEGSEYKQFIEALNALHNFTDDRTGESFGDVSSWGPEIALAVDGLSGLSKASMNLCIGSKPIKTQPDWGNAMDNLQRLVDKLVYDTTCHFVLIGHIEMERDEISGSTKIMPSTLGRKLAPVLPAPFNNVVLASREGTNFFWNVGDPRADLKAVHLPLTDKQKPSFVPLIENWRRKQATAA